MFGMLDYRAHKLYLILFFLPNLALVLFATLGLPVINYSVGISLADNRVIQILISLVSLLILELVWIAFIYGLISKFYQFLFGLFVDIIPSNGRSEEEAK
jgi:ammonia channel protein AmtB